MRRRIRPCRSTCKGARGREEIERIVALELGRPLVAPGSEELARARIICDGTSVTIRVDDASATPGQHAAPNDRVAPAGRVTTETGVRPRPRERSLDLATTPVDVRPRVIALAAVELIVTAPPRSAPAPARVAPDTVAAPDGAGGRSAVGIARAATRVGALASVEVFPGNTGALVGGGLRAVHSGRKLDVFIDARAHHGSSSFAFVGDIDITTIDGALGVARAWSRGRTELAVSVGARGGAARFAGSAEAADVRAERFWAPWFGVCGGADVEHPVAARLRATVGVEVGAVVLPVGALVGGSREVAIDGAWITARGGLLASW